MTTPRGFHGRLIDVFIPDGTQDMTLRVRHEDHGYEVLAVVKIDRMTDPMKVDDRPQSARRKR